MSRKIVCMITLLAFIGSIVGCGTTEKYVAIREGLSTGAERMSDVWVTLRDGSTMRLESVALQGSKLKGMTDEGTIVKVDIEDVEYMWIEQHGNFLLYTMAVVGFITTAVVLTAALTSCPFVYSHNGEEYVLEAEPFGGAIARGLERRDYDVLDHLVPVDGTYRLKLANELDETQYVNELQLVAVDHPAETRVIADRDGHIHTIASQVPLISAVELSGNDVSDRLQKKDHLFWESDMSAKNSQESGDLQDELVLEFSKPAGAENAKLLLHLCNTPWSLHVSKKLLGLLGSTAADWINKTASSTEDVQGLKSYLKREGFLYLEVLAWENNNWISQGHLCGASPLVPKEQVTVLDVSRIEEDTLRVKLRLGAGFWMIDNAMVDYSQDLPVTTTKLEMMEAVDQRGQDIRADLGLDDDRFYVMPNVGDFALIEFDEPSRTPAMERSLILEATGYYEVHLPEKIEAQPAFVLNVLMEPDALTRYSLKSFIELFGQTQDLKPE